MTLVRPNGLTATINTQCCFIITLGYFAITVPYSSIMVPYFPIRVPYSHQKKSFFVTFGVFKILFGVIVITFGESSGRNISTRIDAGDEFLILRRLFANLVFLLTLPLCLLWNTLGTRDGANGLDTTITIPTLMDFTDIIDGL